MTFNATQQDDIVNRGVALFTEMYKDKEDLVALCTSFLNRLQEVEDAAWEVILGYLVDDAIGVQLDTLGVIVGQPRLSEDDDTYRISVKARIRINTSQGQAEDLLELMRLMLPNVSYTYHEVYPAQVVIELDSDTSTVDNNLIASLLFECRAGGVGFRLWYSENDKDEGFQFEDAVVSDDDDEGFGSTTEVIVGGYFASSIDPQPSYTTGIVAITGSPFSAGFDEGFEGI
jgi:hypothetical protein